MSDGSASSAAMSSASVPAFVPGKYKLAEHRYGREEMLALFVPNSKIPECMKSYPSIVSEKPLQPMAFIAPTEEEQVSEYSFRIVPNCDSIKNGDCYINAVNWCTLD